MSYSDRDEVKKPSEMKAHGDRYNDGKLKWSYVNFKAMEPMVRVLMFGSQKYAPKNWMKGLDKVEVLESMQRHLAALMDGQQNDPESGLHHIGHLMCNCMFYSYFDLKEKENYGKQEGNVLQSHMDLQETVRGSSKLPSEFWTTNTTKEESKY